MFKLILILLFFSLCSFAKTYEQAAFRVQDRAFFISDANIYITEIRAFRCLKPSSILLKGLNLHKSSLRSLGKSRVNIGKHRVFFEQLVELVVISRFIQEREHSILPKKLSRKCVKGDASSDLKSFLRSEVFLTDRFKQTGRSPDISTVKTFIRGLKKKSDYEIFD